MCLFLIGRLCLVRVASHISLATSNFGYLPNYHFTSLTCHKHVFVSSIRKDQMFVNVDEWFLKQSNFKIPSIIDHSLLYLPTYLAYYCSSLTTRQNDRYNRSKHEGASHLDHPINAGLCPVSGQLLPVALVQR